MKTKLKIKGLSEQRPDRQKKKGVALLTVLTVMSLATILVLTFFTMAQNELEAATSYAHGMEARHLTETAVNIVISQVRKATTGKGGGGSGVGKRDYAWASQPGAMRQYDVNGNFKVGFKLYSDDQMMVTQESELTQTDVADLSGWRTKPAVFVDLNAPVVRGEKVFYPIVDPRAKEVQGVEGFDYDSAVPGVGPLERSGALRRADSTAKSLPMPVKWIYQLEDGSIGYMQQGGSGGKARYTPVSGASPTEVNPIVGRMAFWADDETTKLNVNTAAGGRAWDTPRAGGDLDRNLGRFQPSQNEWQRYPGHPSTTHLAPVFFPDQPDIVLDRDAMEIIYGLTPRIVPGGSSAGTRKVNPSDPLENNGLIPDKDRLYPSLDEFMLRPAMVDGVKVMGDNGRNENEFPTEYIKALASEKSASEKAAGLLERSRFFLTATSRAPEVTLHNTPRVSIWPSYFKEDASDEQYTTAFDNLIRFCAEMGEDTPSGSPYDDRFIYHFQRMNADSTTEDYDEIPRNQELYRYLDRLMEDPIPGFGGSFRGKYGNDNQNQLLTEVFDYIRSTNLFDDTVNIDNDDVSGWRRAYTFENNSDHRTYTNPRLPASSNGFETALHMGFGQVAPIVIEEQGVATKGFGRFYSVVEAALQLICCADGGTNSAGGSAGWSGGTAYSNFPPQPSNFQPTPVGNATWPGWMKLLPPAEGAAAADKRNWNYQLLYLNASYKGAWDSIPAGSGNLRLGPGEKLVQGAILLKLFTPSMGWVPINPDFQISIDTQGITFGGVGFEDYNNKFAVDDSAGVLTWVANFHSPNAVWGGLHAGGGGGFRTLMRATRGAGKGERTGWALTEAYEKRRYGNAGRRAPFDIGVKNSVVGPTNIYPWITKPVKVAGPTVPVTIPSGALIKVYSHRGGAVPKVNPYATELKRASKVVPGKSGGIKPPELMQTVVIPAGTYSMPAPRLAGGTPEHLDYRGFVTHPETSPMAWWSLTYDGAQARAPAGDNNVSRTGRLQRSNRAPNNATGQYISPFDSVWSFSIPHGDFRLLATAPATTPVPLILHPEGGGARAMAHTMDAGGGHRFPGASGGGGGVHENNIVPFVNYRGGKPIPLQVPSKDWQLYGDFDSGPGALRDGPYINKPDEGNTHSLLKQSLDPPPTGYWHMSEDYGDFPYFVRVWLQEPTSPAYFSPNRMVPSPGMFGSLPTAALNDAKGTGSNKGAWQTLLFRPNVNGENYTTHPGAVSPKDHLLMDLFWMPVVEPYAISEPLSTAGKINMNYQILPFTYIERSTALWGVLQSEVMSTIPNKYARDYKSGMGRGYGYNWRTKPYGGTLQKKSLRTFINEEDTLQQFQDRFDANKIFVSATEICDIHLVPEDLGERRGFSSGIGHKKPSVEDMANGTYWNKMALGSDNGRERPYTDIYPRLTTKSNTYKVHFRAQVVKKAKNRPQDEWDPDYDVPVSEYRGSTVVERYVDQNDPDLAGKDYAIDATLGPIDDFYKFRVLNTRRFAP